MASKHGAARQGSAVAVDLGPGEAGAPWSSDNNCTEDRNREDLDQVLARELVYLGLDEWAQARVKQGAVLKQEGLDNWMSNGRMNTSQHHPGRRDEDPLDTMAMSEARDSVVLRVGQLRSQAFDLMTRGGDVEQWLARLSPTEQDIALHQLDDVISLMEEQANA